MTRTTLREVLQRLARDGWLTIQHGKPTKVNQFMETSGLHILDTLMTLDADNATSIVEDLLAARTNISPIFMRYAFKANKENSERTISSVIESCENLLASESWEDFMTSSPYAEKINNLLKMMASEMKQNVMQLSSRKHLTSMIICFFNVWHSLWQSDLWFDF